MTEGMHICHICGKRFGPTDIDDPQYDEKSKGIMTILRFPNIIGRSNNNTILCPKCAKKVDELIEEYSKTYDGYDEPDYDRSDEQDSNVQSDLKPCPFCSRAIRIIHVEPSGYNVDQFSDEYGVAIEHIEDGECIIDNLMSFNQREESMMIELWNRRVKE